MGNEKKLDGGDTVTVGSVWAGITGNHIVIDKVEGEMAHWHYLNDPEDGSSDEVWKIAEFMDFVSAPSHSDGGATDG